MSMHGNAQKKAAGVRNQKITGRAEKKGGPEAHGDGLSQPGCPVIEKGRCGDGAQKDMGKMRKMKEIFVGMRFAMMALGDEEKMQCGGQKKGSRSAKQSKRGMASEFVKDKRDFPPGRRHGASISSRLTPHKQKDRIPVL